MSEELDLSWLPPSVARRQAADEVQHAAELRREERARQKESEQRAEDARDKAVAAWVTDSIARGEPAGALDVLNGDIGRTVRQVLTANAELTDRVPKEHREPVNYVGDTGGYFPVQRSQRPESRGDGWPASAYQADQLLRKASEMHRALVEYQARRDYPAAEARARAKSEAVRSSPAGYDDEVTRLVAAGFSPETARQAATPMIFR
jgi:hypothetical protein